MAPVSLMQYNLLRFDGRNEAAQESAEIPPMDNQVVEIARLYAEKVKGLMPVSMVILYGSHARGTAKEYSDIDIAVVVDKLHGDYLKTSAELFGLVRTVNKRIEPVLVCREHDKSGFLKNVLEHGKVVYRRQ